MKRKSIAGLFLGLLLFASADDLIAAEAGIPDADAAAADNEYLGSESLGSQMQITLHNRSVSHPFAMLLHIAPVHQHAGWCTAFTHSPCLLVPLYLIVSLQC
jgi:hypothetical protein